MPRNPISKLKPPQLDEDQYYKLFDILHDGIFEGNWSATARFIGISPITIRAWSKLPPKNNPWINHHLHTCILEAMRFIATSPHKKVRKRLPHIREMMARADLHKLKEAAEFEVEQRLGVQRHVMVLIARDPHHEVSSRDLTKPAVSGGYSRRTLLAALNSLPLEKHTRGFGEEKETIYTLPTTS